MGYLLSAKTYLRFDSTNMLVNSITNVPFVSNGTNTTILSATGNLGYVMQENQYLTGSNVSLGISNEMIMGFWLYPDNPGIVVNNSNEIIPLRMSLLDFDNYVLNPSISECNLVLYEETQEDGKNKLFISIEGGSQSNFFLETEPYLSSLWHYFLITYNGIQGFFDVIIDGKKSTTTGTSYIPSSLGLVYSDININRKILIGSSDVSSNNGIIDDFFVLNTCFENTLESEHFVQKIVNHNTDYVLDSDNELLFDIDTGFYISKDPTTISVTSMSKSTNRFFAGRSDGSILEGSSLMWQSIRDFSNTNEMGLLNKNILGDPVSVQDGFVKVNNSVIKI